MKRRCLYLALVCAPAVFAADPAPGLTPEECAVFDRERAFAETVDRHDKQAFTGFLHENAVFGAASPNPQRGRDAILEAWAGIIEGKDVRLEWRPQYVSLGKDMNVAMSRGPFAISGKNEKGETKHAIGNFVSVWTRKDAASPWYVVLDGGGPPPTPATEEEAKRHMATAPATCPRAEGAKPQR